MNCLSWLPPTMLPLTSIELFSNYRVEDYDTLNMKHSSYSKMIEMSDVFFNTNTRFKSIL